MSPGPAAAVRVPNLDLTFVQGVPVLVLDESATFDGLRAAIRAHLPRHLSAIGGRTCRLELGAREIHLFDLRRTVHLLKQEYSIEITGLYVRGAVIHRFAERELKLKLFPNDPEPDELETEELGFVADEAPEAAVLLLPQPGSNDPSSTTGGGANALGAVTLPHDLRPEDLDPTPVAAPSEVVPLVLKPVPAPPPAPAAPVPAPSPGATTGATGSRSHVLHKTLRSGTIVRVEGDLFVFGDVNPGAQVTATGSVTVLGALKGAAHAGAEGDRSAFVMALELAPTQLKIGRWVANGEPRKKVAGPQIAVVEDEAIVLEPYRGRPKP